LRLHLSLNDIKNMWGFHPLQEAYYLQLKEENEKLIPARIVSASHELFSLRLLGHEKEYEAKVRGQFFHQKNEWPVVGDWVLVEDSGLDHQHWPIEQILPRRSSLKRVVDGGKEQVMAVNMDYITIVTSFNLDLNARRIERALAMVEEGGARPLIIVNKNDLIDAAVETEILSNFRHRFTDVAIFSCSAEKNQGIQGLIDFFKNGDVVAFLGMSGVGKSTLVNRLLQRDVLKTHSIRSEDARGRHTTTHRELFLTTHQFWVLDSPGIRQFSYAGDEDQLDSVFSDITELFHKCRFRDCLHQTEPECEVRQKLEAGQLNEDRWRNYLKMKRESEFHENKTNKKFLSEQKKFNAKRTMQIRSSKNKIE
jgi:ribosome biogenesis GTPase / thiamine phosphate phosphatase